MRAMFYIFVQRISVKGACISKIYSAEEHSLRNAIFNDKKRHRDADDNTSARMVRSQKEPHLSRCEVSKAPPGLSLRSRRDSCGY